MGMRINAELPLPADLKAEYPLTEEILNIKKKRDREIRDIFTGKSDKFIVIVGPCSADNEDSVCEYVSRLARVNEKVSDRLLIIPRIYTNKPRTTGEGYKGMLHQPSPDKAPDLLHGLIAIRKMHIRAMRESGLTAADEYRDAVAAGQNGSQQRQAMQDILVASHHHNPMPGMDSPGDSDGISGSKGASSASSV